MSIYGSSNWGGGNGQQQQQQADLFAGMGGAAAVGGGSIYTSGGGSSGSIYAPAPAPAPPSCPGKGYTLAPGIDIMTYPGASSFSPDMQLVGTVPCAS